MLEAGNASGFRLDKAIQMRKQRALPARKGISGARGSWAKQRRKWRSQPAGKRVTQSKTGAKTTQMTGKLLLAKLLHKPRGKANQARGERKLGGKTKNQMAAGSKQVGRYWEAVTQADQAHSPDMPSLQPAHSGKRL